MMRTSGTASPLIAGAVALSVLVATSGCQQPQRKLVTHPPGTLIVHYEEASAPSACLVASVAMAANYVLGEREFTEPDLRAALRRQNLDETRVADVQAFLRQQGLEMVALAGRPDGEPPLGLRYWLVRRGYPVICIINQHDGDPELNHAVVVTGFSANPEDPSADIVYYLDPATRDPLQSVGLAEFQAHWAHGNHAMMIVVQPPSEPAGVVQPTAR